MLVLHVEIKDAYARLDAQDKHTEHRYRFERSGALWRYDETTGKFWLRVSEKLGESLSWRLDRVYFSSERSAARLALLS